MARAHWLAALLMVTQAASLSWACGLGGRRQLDKVNKRLHGQVLDYTHNHGNNRRIWSDALCAFRDLYVYVPPCFDPEQQYPLLLWLHMGRADEQDFLDNMVHVFDHAIAAGKLPPFIIAVPDGSLRGRPNICTAGSFYINSMAGDFEDYIMKDVWNFVFAHFPIKPERDAHVLAGASMGGFGAFNLSIKYRDRVKTAVAFIAPLNVRWVDCYNRYRSNFDPCCWGWRVKFRRHEVVACFHGIPVMLKHFTDPIFGRGPCILGKIIQENPAEMLKLYDVQPGQLNLYVGYGGQDELNTDAQVESFLALAHDRGLDVGVGYDPKGKHNTRTILKLFPGAVEWLGMKMGTCMEPEPEKLPLPKDMK